MKESKSEYRKISETNTSSAVIIYSFSVSSYHDQASAHLGVVGYEKLRSAKQTQLHFFLLSQDRGWPEKGDDNFIQQNYIVLHLVTNILQ